MKLRRTLIAIGLVGLIGIIAANLGQWPKLLDALHHMRWYLIPLLVAMQIISYWANAGFYQSFFRLNGRRVSFKKLTGISLAINFANQAIPAGGVAGTTFLAEALHDEVPTGQATLSQLARYIFTFLSYFAVLAVGFILLFFSGEISKISVRFVILVMLILLMSAIVLLVVFSERRRLEATLAPVIRALNWFGRAILRRHNPILTPAAYAGFLDEFYAAYQVLARSRRGRIELWWWALAGNVFEILSLYVVFIGFGTWVNLGVVITAYTLAIIVSIAGLLTNGIGVYEAGMIGALTALGQPFSLSVAVVLVYRVLGMVIFLPPGFVYYRRYLGSASA